MISGRKHPSKRKSSVLFFVVAALLVFVPISFTCAVRIALDALPFPDYLRDVFFGFSMDGILSFLGIVGSILVAIWQIRLHQSEIEEEREHKQEETRKRIERRLKSLKPDVFVNATTQACGQIEVRMRNDSPFLVYGIYIGETPVLDKLLSGDERIICISSRDHFSNKTSSAAEDAIMIDESYMPSEDNDMLFVQLYDRDGNLWNIEFNNIFSGEQYGEPGLIETRDVVFSCEDL